MNKSPLHKTVHWRRFKKLTRLICKLENINVNNYNLEHITCYSTVGMELNRRKCKIRN